MRKYVVPCAALLGIALLSPRANAVTLVLKSRAIPPAVTYTDINSVSHTYTGNGSVPVSAFGVSANQLWGLDMGLAFDATKISLRNDATVGAAFTPDASNYTSTSDVVVSGSTFVGTGTQPNGYVGFVRGAAPINTANSTTVTGAPGAPVGKINVTLSATAATYPYPSGTPGTVLPIVPLGTTGGTPGSYNVLNTGDTTGSSRPSAQGVTSTATAGAPVASEAVTVASVFPGYTDTTLYNAAQVVPAGEIAVGIPGDVNGDGIVSNADGVSIARMLVGLGTAFDDYKKIAGDVAPGNNYSQPGQPASSNPADFGGSYGDGYVANNDAVTIARLVVNFGTSATTFPIPEP